MKPYTISAGYFTSILAERHQLDHSTEGEALRALYWVINGNLVSYRGDDGVLRVYRSQADADADNDGSDAIATISRAAAY